ncbi:hypothetical protein Pint_33961 [Pistacia integerrima]|uniref:Uncharacterized protein n=1 Tax=Pistacia integerrima TaxID=434235 RepID=A0ACC0X624_9ROSI|nr:hypothetical protein Pint_33961 [Pistacia integerrima]
MYKVCEINPAHARVGRFLIDVGQIIKHPPPNNRRRSRVAIANIFGETDSDVKFICGKAKSTLLPEENYSVIRPQMLLIGGLLVFFLYEMLYGRTPFRGKNRQKTFANILHKDLTFPSSILVKIYRLLSRLKLFSCYSGESVDIVYMLRILSPPSLDAPPELIEKDLKAKDVKWEDDGVLVNPKWDTDNEGEMEEVPSSCHVILNLK